MLNSKQIEIFHTVYQERSITGAARLLKVSQPSISKTLSLSEDKLGYLLFNRFQKRLLPTPEADALYEESKNVINRIQSFNNIAKNLLDVSSEYINIGCTPSLGLTFLPKLIKKYQTKDKSSKFNITNLQSQDLEDQLEELLFDCVISFNQKESERFEKHVLRKGSLVLIGPENDDNKFSPNVSLKELTSLPMIRIKNLKTNSTQNSLDDQLKKSGIDINWIMQTETIQVAKAMVNHGLGYAIIDDYSAALFFESEKKYKLVPNMKYEFGLMINHEKPLSHHAKAFIDFVKSQN
tara:strand:- start:1259 stop:2140 length:882 start_codon:yes stop_codon:yes gene_type:complete